jgi:hypothetical protein
MTTTTASLPQILTSLNSWLVWRLVKQDGEQKPRKVPYYVGNGEPRSNNGTPEDRAQLVLYERAAAAVAKGYWTGVGLAMLDTNNLVALDFDHCIDDEGVIDPRVERWCEGTYSEISPSGRGVRAFFRGRLANLKGTKDGFAVEVFCTSGYVTVTGKPTPMCEMFGWDVAPVSETCLAMYREHFSERARVAESLVRRDASGDAPWDAPSDNNWLVSLSSKVGLTLEKAERLLQTFDNEGDGLDYDAWLNTGMCVHHEFDGSDEALAMWLRWSAKSSKFNEKDARRRWESFGRFAGSPLTAAWLLKHAKQNRVEQKYEALVDYKAKIAEATDEFDLRERLCQSISKDGRLTDVEREQIAQLLCDKFRGLGTKYGIALVRKMVAQKREPKARGDADLPEWLKGWVYVTDEDKFFRLDSDETLTMQGFNARFNRMVPCDEDGAISKSASWIALEDYSIETVTRGMYLPWGSSLFEMEGVKYANKYRASSVPQAAAITGQGRKSVDLVVDHIKLLCNGRERESDLLLSWIAHNVQHPGLKIRWCPLIKGIQGDGKSLIGTLMQAIMGRANVRNISPKVLGTDFTGWAEGASIGVLEEIKLTGHNRYDILNAIKPFVTNDSIEIHRKGMDTYEAVNTMNYIAFTNHGDALPLEDGERRFFVIFTPFGSEVDLSEALADLGGGRYFELLHAGIEQHRAELRQFFLEYPLAQGFDRNGRAPKTAEKQQMVLMSMSAEEEAARDAIEAGAVGVTRDVVSSACLTAALALSDDPFVLETTKINRLLSKMGFSRCDKKVKWKGRAHIVWTRGNSTFTGEQIRQILDSTEVPSLDDFFN